MKKLYNILIFSKINKESITNYINNVIYDIEYPFTKEIFINKNKEKTKNRVNVIYYY